MEKYEGRKSNNGTMGQEMTNSINSFRGEYEFLSNFYSSPIKPFDDLGEFPTVEHAYVAYKTNDQIAPEYIRSIPSPGQAKKYGRTVELADYWDDTFRIHVMTRLIELKFSPGSELAQKLVDTGSIKLVEGNQHGDKFFGECPLGNGYNYLGKILMRRRSVLQVMY